jgi:hypothetical protein
MDRHDKEQRNATESTRKAREDRANTRDSSAPASGATATTSTSKETNPVKDETAGRSTREDSKEITESSTKAAAIVVQAKIPERKFAVCPRCHERRYRSEQVGTIVKCINCRASVVLT